MLISGDKVLRALLLPVERERKTGEVKKKRGKEALSAFDRRGSKTGWGSTRVADRKRNSFLLKGW